jgi:putative transposase
VKRSKFTEEQIITALKEVDAGRKLEEVTRKLGITATTFYRWKAKFAGMRISDAKRLRHLEEENRRLKQMVADQALDLQGLRSVLKRKW